MPNHSTKHGIAVFCESEEPTPSPVSSGSNDCSTLTNCRNQAEELGFGRVYAGDYSYANAFGCFSKRGRAYWGYGGTDAQMSEELSGEKERSECAKRPGLCVAIWYAFETI